MKVINAFAKGWKKVIQSFVLCGLLYGMNFLFAFIVALPLKQLMDKKLSHSMEPQNLLAGFDFTVVVDFLNEYGVRDAFPNILANTQIIAIVFFFFSVFLTGGILAVFKNREEGFTRGIFWEGCAQYFWRLLRLTLYFLIIQVGILSIFFFILNAMTSGFDIEAIAHEGVIFDSIKILIPFYLICSGIIAMISDYAKIHMVHLDEAWLFKPFFGSFKIGLKKFFKTYPLFFLNFLIFVLILGVYWFLSERIITDNFTSILLLFVLGQVFILGRIFVKVLRISTATEMYRSLVYTTKNSEIPSLENQQVAHQNEE